ncbi:TlpA disulfide reductase family protein [Hymenobacter nivis]|uniref:TlpA family protein disulfide reductase n=1 Tax=Hymenobacter nivis TaxID=1850093 RepID=A0A502HD87_9BACT|nr:TlpA disulfide reductase family protein [Hymenobacter nivis]TPG72491.1 TlpA family protein disulfide reductase [Hymenobacter nivis]
MKNVAFALLAGALLSLAGCQGTSSPTGAAAAGGTSATALLTPGPWRGELAMQGQQLPFLFEVKTEAGQPVVYLINKGLNGEERLRCPEISAAGDSATIRLHAFDAALVVRADGAGKLKGNWVKYDAKGPYRVPLVASAGAQPLFVDDDSGEKKFIVKVSGGKSVTLKVLFEDEKGNSYPAVGVLSNTGKNYTGTFLTTTGDYRYLAGNLVGRKDSPHLLLSTFDGSHAFLFDAKEQPNSTLKGDFYSGKSGHETWTAVPDPKAKLPDADTLTYLKKGESRLSFKFPSVVPGASISPTDPKYRGKVVVLQVLGSWCPNCMDETNFLAPWYEKNKQRGVEIIGLGYERMPEYDKAAARLRGMKERFNIGYDVAVAGVSNKDSVAKSLPQLAKFLAFPTTIFIDKKGAVRKIHTGFSGPGTGKYYAEETAAFNQEIDKLLKE